MAFRRPLDEEKFRELYATGMSQVELGKIFKFSQSGISGIAKRMGLDGRPCGSGSLCRDQRGSKNPGYKNGLSRSTVRRYAKATLIDAERDLKHCDACNSDFSYNLNVHHKDRDRSNNRSSNLEILCESCHAKEHINERPRDEYGRLT